MSKQYDQLIRNQAKARVVAKAETDTANHTWLAVFAFAFMGFFFFFSDTLGRVLSGG